MKTNTAWWRVGPDWNDITYIFPDGNEMMGVASMFHGDMEMWDSTMDYEVNNGFDHKNPETTYGEWEMI